MATKKPVPVKILDQTFMLSTDSSEERVKKVAQYVNETLTEAQAKNKKNPSPYNNAVLTALNIAEKYYDLLDRHAQLKQQISERSKKIMGLLDSVRPGPNAS